MTAAKHRAEIEAYLADSEKNTGDNSRLLQETQQLIAKIDPSEADAIEKWFVATIVAHGPRADAMIGPAFAHFDWGAPSEAQVAMAGFDVVRARYDDLACILRLSDNEHHWHIAFKGLQGPVGSRDAGRLSVGTVEDFLTSMDYYNPGILALLDRNHLNYWRRRIKDEHHRIDNQISKKHGDLSGSIALVVLGLVIAMSRSCNYNQQQDRPAPAPPPFVETMQGVEHCQGNRACIADHFEQRSANEKR
jgi:hypothetical protein